MIRVKNISLCNFLSIGNCTQYIDLHLAPLTLILGENVDSSSGIDRNGAGKTSILQAISYALFGEPLTKITLDNLCNTYNVKGMMVTIDFERDGKSYRIERGRKPNLLRWYIDGEHDSAQGENKQTQADIERVLGMSHTMFRHIIALNTYTTPFLREKASEQREIIEELLGITQLSQRAEELKKLLDITKEAIRDQEAMVKATSEANARIQMAVDRAKADAEVWKTAHDKTLADLLMKAEHLDGIDFDNEIAKFDSIDQWQQHKREIDDQIDRINQQRDGLEREIVRRQHDRQRYELEAAASEDTEIKRLQQQAEQCRAEGTQDIQSQTDRLVVEATRYRRAATDKLLAAEQLAADIERLQIQIADPRDHHCLTCGQELSEAPEVIAHLTTKVAQITEQIELLLEESDQCNQQGATIDAELVQLHANHELHHQHCLVKAATIEQEIETIEATRHQKQAMIHQHGADMQADIDQLVLQQQENEERLKECHAMVDQLGLVPRSRYGSRNAVWQLRQERDLLLHQIETEIDKPNPHATKVEGLVATLVTIDYDSLNNLTVTFKHESFLYKLLTAKDSFIRKKVVDQNLRYLNKRLDHFVARLGLPHEVRFLPDLTVEITLLGRDFDFEQLSRGEMNRLILATAFAFRDTWENLNHAVNLLFIDEYCDQGLDSAGVDAAVNLLTEIAQRQKNVFLISHRDELKSRSDDVLLARKENNFTTFACQ